MTDGLFLDASCSCCSCLFPSVVSCTTHLYDLHRTSWTFNSPSSPVVNSTCSGSLTAVVVVEALALPPPLAAAAVAPAEEVEDVLAKPNVNPEDPAAPDPNKDGVAVEDIVVDGAVAAMLANEDEVALLLLLLLLLLPSLSLLEGDDFIVVPNPVLLPSDDFMVVPKPSVVEAAAAPNPPNPLLDDAAAAAPKPEKPEPEPKTLLVVVVVLVVVVAVAPPLVGWKDEDDNNDVDANGLLVLPVADSLVVVVVVVAEDTGRFTLRIRLLAKTSSDAFWNGPFGASPSSLLLSSSSSSPSSLVI